MWRSLAFLAVAIMAVPAIAQPSGYPETWTLTITGVDAGIDGEHLVTWQPSGQPYYGFTQGEWYFFINQQAGTSWAWMLSEGSEYEFDGDATWDGTQFIFNDPRLVYVVPEPGSGAFALVTAAAVLLRRGRLNRRSA
jgi:hypothetical protein